MTSSTFFQRVSAMNVAFDNPKGDYSEIEWERVRSQCKNIGHEFVELMEALGLDELSATMLGASIEVYTANSRFRMTPDPIAVRDALVDIPVFASGGQHMLGVDGDMDGDDVVDGVMTRFIKDEADKEATIAKHASKGVTDVYFVGEYPTMVMKSASDQPDAPKGKFLKSASYRDTVFREPPKTAA